MSKKILFSPVGGTDPIKYCRDGSMLHICRHYLPDIVYLYLSHEIMVNHRKDNRYVDSIERLGQFLGHPFEIHVIERDEVVNVQKYDFFYADFREEIQKIEEGMDEGDELLLNVASGTPAMKSALNVMAAFAEYRFRPIQVDSPKKAMNEEHEERKDYDNELFWELDEDNEKDAPNRCEEVNCLNLTAMLKKEIIKKHIKVYDYTAALAIASEIKRDISEDAYRLLQIADARIRLDQSRISVLMREKEYDIFPIRQGGQQKEFEYALWLQAKLKRQEYADFTRGITPLIVDLLEDILKRWCQIRLDDCTTERKDGSRRWDEAKLKRFGLWEPLDVNYRESGGFRCGDIYSGHLAVLIEFKSEDAVLVQRVKEITAIERNIRNLAAHEIVSVTGELFRKRAGKSAEETFGLIRYLTSMAGIHVKEDDWESYDKMNGMIISYL